MRATLVRFLPHALLTACLVSVANGAAATTIDVYFGDVDGFGFSDVSTLVDGTGLAPADKNSNGVLDEGDSLPNLGVNPGVDPAFDDYFDNRTGDPTDTDVGFTAGGTLSLDFVFAIPVGEIVTGARFSLLAGDLSLVDVLLHTISIDGQPTGETLTPISFDGEITLTSITVDNSLLGEFTDGAVSVGLVFGTATDDIAIDYGLLSVTTQLPIPEPSTLTLLGLGLCALAGWRRSRV